MNGVRELALRHTKKINITVFDTEIGSKLPEAYKKFYNEWRWTPSEPLHFLPHTGSIWERNETTGEIKRRENISIPTRFPKELHNVFTGGELVVQGFIQKHRYANRAPRFWMPVAYRSVIYSEILDKYLSVLMTKRVVELIYKHQGLDSYLLQTKACDLKTMVALKLKKRLLLALSNRDLPYDEKKNSEILKKYEQYLIPPEEIEWYGLNFTEACNKYKEMEKAQEEAKKIPLKHIYRAQLIEQLKENVETKDEGETPKQSVFSKIPGLGKLGNKISR